MSTAMAGIWSISCKGVYSHSQSHPNLSLIPIPKTPNQISYRCDDAKALAKVATGTRSLRLAAAQRCFPGAKVLISSPTRCEWWQLGIPKKTPNQMSYRCDDAKALAEGKDVFEAFNMKDLVERMLLGKRPSIDKAEKSIISEGGKSAGGGGNGSGGDGSGGDGGVGDGSGHFWLLCTVFAIIMIGGILFRLYVIKASLSSKFAQAEKTLLSGRDLTLTDLTLQYIKEMQDLYEEMKVHYEEVKVYYEEGKVYYEEGKVVYKKLKDYFNKISSWKMFPLLYLVGFSWFLPLFHCISGSFLEHEMARKAFRVVSCIGALLVFLSIFIDKRNIGVLWGC